MAGHWLLKTEPHEYSFADLLIIKQVANELERGTPLKVILRALLAEHQGQLELDFHAAPDTPRAKVVALQGRRTTSFGVTGATPLTAGILPKDGSVQAFPFTDPQTALAAKYFIEELGVDVNIRDAEGFTALHHAAARGDNTTIMYLIGKGANVMAVNRAGQTTVDMANSPEQRTQPFPETIKLLEAMGAKNNNNCRACK